MTIIHNRKIHQYFLFYEYTKRVLWERRKVFYAQIDIIEMPTYFFETSAGFFNCENWASFDIFSESSTLTESFILAKNDSQFSS